MERPRGRRGVVAATAVSAATFFALGAAVGTRRAERADARRRARAEVTRSVNGGGGKPSTEAAAAAAREAERAADAALDCPVCLAELVLPRVLGCGHSLCTGCLVRLAAHEQRPCCPVCRKRIHGNVTELPVNFAAAAVVEARVAARGPTALAALRAAEEAARASSRRTPPGGGGSAPVLGQLRPAWNWFKWTAIIVTEFGAFLVSLKEVLEARPSRTRRYQRIV